MFFELKCNASLYAYRKYKYIVTNINNNNSTRSIKQEYTQQRMIKNVHAELDRRVRKKGIFL